MADTTSTISEAVSSYESMHQITHGQMAELLGMSANTLRWKCSGAKDWKWSEILHLSELLGVTPDELAGIAN